LRVEGSGVGEFRERVSKFVGHQGAGVCVCTYV